MLEFFTQRGNVFVSKPFRYGSLVIAVIFFVFTFTFLVLGYKLKIGHHEYSYIFFPFLFFPLGIFFLGRFLERVELNVVEKTITISYWGFGRKKYTYRGFQKIVFQRNLLRVRFLYYHGTVDIIMCNSLCNTVDEITIFSSLVNENRARILIREILWIIKIEQM